MMHATLVADSTVDSNARLPASSAGNHCTPASSYGGGAWRAESGGDESICPPHFLLPADRSSM